MTNDIPGWQKTSARDIGMFINGMCLMITKLLLCKSLHYDGCTWNLILLLSVILDVINPQLRGLLLYIIHHDWCSGFFLQTICVSILLYFMAQYWTDLRLAWKSAHYGNLSFVTMDATKVWIPMIGLTNRLVWNKISKGELNIRSYCIKVNSNGLMNYVPRFCENMDTHIHSSKCGAKSFTQW